MTWRPRRRRCRAATSVATSTRSLSSRNLVSAFARDLRHVAPCSGLALNPRSARSSATRCACRLVRVKTMILPASSACRTRPMISGLSRSLDLVDELRRRRHRRVLRTTTRRGCSSGAACACAPGHDRGAWSRRTAWSAGLRGHPMIFSTSGRNQGRASVGLVGTSACVVMSSTRRLHGSMRRPACRRRCRRPPGGVDLRLVADAAVHGQGRAGRGQRQPARGRWRPGAQARRSGDDQRLRLCPSAGSRRSQGPGGHAALEDRDAEGEWSYRYRVRAWPIRSEVPIRATESGHLRMANG